VPADTILIELAVPVTVYPSQILFLIKLRRFVPSDRVGYTPPIIRIFAPSFPRVSSDPDGYASAVDNGKFSVPLVYVKGNKKLSPLFT
jgi:hypothetical protein